MNKEELIKYFNDLIGGFNTNRWEKGSEADFINQAYNYMCKIEQENKQLKSKLEMYENGVYYSSENDKLKEVIEEVRKSIEDYQEYIDEAKEFYSDLEDDDVVKVSNLQILNNQMVRNYDLLQILDKAKNR